MIFKKSRRPSIDEGNRARTVVEQKKSDCHNRGRGEVTLKSSCSFGG